MLVILNVTMGAARASPSAFTSTRAAVLSEFYSHSYHTTAEFLMAGQCLENCQSKTHRILVTLFSKKRPQELLH